MFALTHQNEGGGLETSALHNGLNKAY